MKKRKTKFIKLGIFLFGISVFLLNCEKEVVEIPVEQNSQDNLLNLSIENLTFDKANNEQSFKDLKNKYNVDDFILDNTKNKESSKDFSDLDPSIDISVIKKIEKEDYISYTMRIDAPANESNSFFNLVIQESNGIQEIFTVKYTPSENQAKTTTKSNTFDGTYTMSKGICLPDQNGNCSNDDENEPSGGDFVEICYDVIVLVNVPCTGSNHYFGDSSCQCQVTDFSCQRAKYELQTQQECYWDYQGNTGTSGGTNTSSGNNNNGGGSNNNSTNPNGNVITTPISEILPEGALITIIECITPNQSQTDWLNNELANQSTNVVDIWNYINESSCEESKDIIIESIDESILNNEDFEEIFKRKKGCEKLKSLVIDNPDTNIKTHLQNLQPMISQTGEHGSEFTLDTSDNYNASSVPSSSNNNLTFNLRPELYAIAHTHPLSAFPMFSFKDVFLLYGINRKARSDLKNKAVVFMVSKENATSTPQTYAITINNINTFYNKLTTELNNIQNSDEYSNQTLTTQEKVDKLIESYEEEEYISTNRELTFLNFFSNYDISLYKASDSNIRGWSRLTSNTNSASVTTKPCN